MARLALLPVAGLVSSFTTLIPTIRSLRDIWLAFDLAMSANPLGAAIVAAVALGAAAYEVYEHWAAITELFQGPMGQRRGVVSVGLGRDQGARR